MAFILHSEVNVQTVTVILILVTGCKTGHRGGYNCLLFSQLSASRIQSVLLSCQNTNRSFALTLSRTTNTPDIPIPGQMTRYLNYLEHPKL